MKVSRNHLIWVGGASLLAGALSVFFLAGSSVATVKALNPRPVLVAMAHYESQFPDRSFVGTVRPRIESDLGFRVAGKVLNRLVEVGSKVKEGQPLATLDDGDFKLQVEQAEAEFRAATSSVAQADAAQERTSSLHLKGWSTDAQFDQAKAAATEARSRLNRAERAVELAKNNASYATLIADAEGVVTATSIEPGQVVAAGQAAIRVARLSEKEVVVSIPETLLERARLGKAKAAIWSNGDKKYDARLRELSPSADAATRTYLAKFSLPDAGNDVQLGMTATLILSGSATAPVARLPLSALFDSGEGPSLYVVDEAGAVTLKRVSVVAYESRDVVISSGVNEGDKIVAVGVQKLDVSQKVRVVSSLAF